MTTPGNRPRQFLINWVAGLVLLACTVVAGALRAQPAPEAGKAVLAGEKAASETAIPEIGEPPELGDLAGKPIRGVDVVLAGKRWTAGRVAITSVKPGEPLGPEAARRAVRELLATGGYARATVEAVREGDGVRLRVHALPRRLVATIQMSGGVLDQQGTLEAGGLNDQTEITEPGLAEIEGRIQDFYTKHGFTAATAKVDTADTDDPTKVVVSIEIAPGEPRIISERVFVVDPRADRELGDLKQRYKLGSGARVDEPALSEADRELTDELRQHGFYRARVSHALRHVGPYSYLYVYLVPGPRLVPTFDGNRAFDSDDLEAALSLGKASETKPAELVDRIRTFYVVRGFLDAEVQATERGAADDTVHYLAFTIRENAQVRVTRRVFPCLPKEESADGVGSEIESYLDEELPGSDLFGAPDPKGVDQTLGPTTGAGGRARPLRLVPAATYAPETYDRALKHLRDIYHARGYLNAVIGPIAVIRATCSKSSPPGQCIPAPPPPGTPAVRAQCQRDALGLPLPEPEVPEAMTCHPDPKHDVTCSPEVTIRIPIHLGPQTTLYDLAFENNRIFTEKELAKVADLTLGDPLSNVEAEAARLRVLDEYHARGYAYAEVRIQIEPSPDRTRARVRFVITERDPVIITGFVVKGAVRTSEPLILGRMALKTNMPYSQNLARTSEERIAKLGTFSSVSVGLEDPDVPQRNKRVIVTVVEQLPQYLDPRIGFSTGEGVRFGFEYGHRNIGGQAIALTLRVQLNYLFDFMILDEDVRRNYNCARRDAAGRCRRLTTVDRLERRDTASITFPEIGLGPLVSLSLDGIDVRDNQRDFGITKDAFVPSVSYQPVRQVTTTLGTSLELNQVQIFEGGTVEAAIKKNPSLASLLRVPDGETIAVAERLSFSWDRRDNPFAATKGTLFASAVEHVNAFPSNITGNQATIKSHFLKFTGRIAGYVRLTQKGTAIALSLSGGYNFQLNDTSKTYPDRLFFLGGVDSLRSFLSDSVVPEDIAQKILHPGVPPLVIEDVAIRGGDLALNPRAELRVPLNDTFQLGFFLDTGNLWVDPSNVSLFALRYGAGPGFRINTPIGPLALDYGVNLIRRPWEDFGAFHFSIGLF